MFLKCQALLLLTVVASQCENKNLIKDCPEEKIINTMPTVGDFNQPKEYYIYKGERKEINEFDATWISENCKVPVTEVH